MLSYFLQGLGLGLPAAAQPGPFQAYLISQTLKNGWRRTLPAALSPLFSDGPIVALVLLVLTQLPPSLLVGIKLAGALFLLWLAWGAWRSFRRYQPIATVAGDAARQSLLEATTMNLLNPNPYIFWGTIGGPLLLEAWRTSPAHALGYLLGFYGTLMGGMALVILLFGTAAQFGPRVTRGLLGVAALALALFGAWQLWEGLRALQG